MSSGHDWLRRHIALRCLRNTEPRKLPLPGLLNPLVNIDVAALPDSVGLVEAAEYNGRSLLQLPEGLLNLFVGSIISSQCIQDVFK